MSAMRKSLLLIESLGLNTYRMNVGSCHLTEFCLFFVEQLPNRHRTSQTLRDYSLDQTECPAYAYLSPATDGSMTINKGALSTLDGDVQKHIKQTKCGIHTQRNILKRNEILIHATTQKNIENAMLDEINQTQKGKYCRIPLI